ncbi:MAG: hypothetical protein ACM3ZA_15510 [Bacillota bacterium]
MRKVLTAALVLVLSLALAGCSALLPGSGFGGRPVHQSPMAAFWDAVNRQSSSGGSLMPGTVQVVTSAAVDADHYVVLFTGQDRGGGPGTGGVMNILGVYNIERDSRLGWQARSGGWGGSSGVLPATAPAVGMGASTGGTGLNYMTIYGEVNDPNVAEVEAVLKDGTSIRQSVPAGQKGYLIIAPQHSAPHHVVARDKTGKVLFDGGAGGGASPATP